MQVLVERPLQRQRLQQRDGLVGKSALHECTGEIPHEARSNRAEAVAVRRCPVLIEVLG